MQESLIISTYSKSTKTSMHNVLNDTNTSQSFPIYNSLNLSDLTKVFNSLPFENFKIFYTYEYKIFIFFVSLNLSFHCHIAFTYDCYLKQGFYTDRIGMSVSNG